MDRYRYWTAVPLPHNRGRLVPVVIDGELVLIWEPNR